MPIYDYQCDECGLVFEVTRKRTDPEPEKCPQCGKSDPRRAISATAFQLKGSGWYVTDYKGSNPSNITKNGPLTSSSEDAGASEASGSTESSESTASTESSSSGSSDSAPTSGEVA